MRDRRARWPYALNATSTHDTKRGEDLRARIDVLSEMPDQWAAAVARWTRWNAPHRRMLAGRAVPDSHEEWLIYQTLAGAWPLPGQESDEAFGGRIVEYMRKVLREAKVHSSWMFPNEAYEDAVLGFVAGILGSEEAAGSRFRADLAKLAGVLAWHGMLNGLGQVVLKVACPGVPDFYQGTELWSPTLVDPDNRRPVDFAARAAMLGKLEGIGDPTPEMARGLIESWEDGLVKLHVIRAALHLRRRRTEVFLEGDYRALGARGTHARRACAFTRGGGAVLAVVPRLTRGIARVRVPPVGVRWKDTAIDVPAKGPDAWRNVFTGETVPRRRAGLPVADVLRSFPVALLEAL
jgi:(1->4)-alpha-D-glucan 1-alpha-D-glucosylmutase